MASTILVTDDDPVQRRLLEATVSKLGCNVLLAENGVEALAVLRSEEGKRVNCLVLDLVMPELDGMGVLAALKNEGRTIPVIVQTSQGSIDTVVTAMRAGATDFVVKPVSPQRLGVSLTNALKLGTMEEVVRTVNKRASGGFTFADMIADSPVMDKVKRLGQRAAGSNIPVLIEGESGVGKEVIAKAIQGESDRSGKPFVTVNCGALPENLVESILFGHEKGAFTGATQSHIGKFKEADGGTLFLDEVGELSLDMQVKLLRALQEGEIDPVGAKRPVKTDFRLISATNRDMIEQVKRGEFREDLFYRLNVFPIHLPPLRERRLDIPALTRHFVARVCMEEGRRDVDGVSNEAMAMLEGYDWPGNIRQLENTVFRAVILSDGGLLGVDEFPQIATALGVDTDIPAAPIQSDSGDIASIAERVPPSSTRLVDQAGELRKLEEVENDVIRFAVQHCRGRMTRVARDLGIGRSTLYRKLRELGLQRESDTEVA